MEKIHFVGVGGTGTGTLAAALAAQGHSVSGSDGTLYEPMKSVLASANIQLLEGYKPENLEKVNPDVVLIGNVVRKDNPEAVAWIRKGTRFISFPEAVRRYVIGDRCSVVCAGTHGKTTTTSWIAFLFRELGWDPSYLIGGVPADLPSGCAITSGKYFVGEGDEYDSAFFDKGPKFLHYAPNVLVLSNIEFDHADIYKDLAHVQASFDKLVALLPGNGLCLVRHEETVARTVSEGAICPVQTFGFTAGAHWRVLQTKQDTDGISFELEGGRRNLGWFRTPLFGLHNVMNLVSGIGAAIHFGGSPEKIRAAVEKFSGAKRRQQILLREPVTVVDDFAHHPTEVAATLKAVRDRYPQGTLWAFFEPRSATARRGSHQEQYPAAFACADKVLLCAPYRATELPEGQRFSTDSLVDALKAQGKDARTYTEPQAMVDAFRAESRPGDIAVVMSNGEFGKIQEKLILAVR
ncbi:hypothetical protein K2X33_02925 [bacterium]|nr:hypothetical protein [bacterium]